jgi:putative oxidoreductase
MAAGRLVLRAAIGGVMLGHGLQKLTGSFDGPGLEGTEKMMTALELHPAKQQALAAALSETVGGALTAAGLLSPLGPAMVLGTMAVAVHKVHLKNGFWSSNRGYEYNLTLIAGALALAIEGPGSLSLDRLLGRERTGLGWGLAAAGAAAGGAAATVAIAKRFAPDSAPAATVTSAPAADANANADASDGADPDSR